MQYFDEIDYAPTPIGRGAAAETQRINGIHTIANDRFFNLHVEIAALAQCHVWNLHVEIAGHVLFRVWISTWRLSA
ncbi:hypothetical protein CFB47_39165 [Burkholderia sp. AU27893]|uniref:hypothetical protein n=1 Tax=Burkholderia multivorans TaxID=87883 RepID=UPI000845EEAF|nr:hypothetical protein [Burkholderia multivorans]MBA9834110.1 hypothetical protein [Burkholderia contaminans]OXI51537.1 hypothetical protein CFB47_39165 [Burkholderia sp. AU27893]MBA9842142.1 hypothetical protein [Burkholderia contaminans]MBA9867035.1 hypothetical protein [Burkholderia contaminans]MBA9909750.1 hypothetical protein [Burkholderia contaminans]